MNIKRVKEHRVNNPKYMELEPRDPIDRWIAELVGGRSFLDLGGIGEESVNERVGYAVKSGAAQAVMADIQPFSFHQWATFEQRMVELGVAEFGKYEDIDINDPLLPEKLPCFDIVHSTGIFYHLANPVQAMNNLVKIVGEYMIVNTVILPPTIKNASGELRFEGNTALFLPGISEKERGVFRVHYKNKFGWDINDTAPRLEDPQVIMPYRKDGKLSCWPYWWLFTQASFCSLVRLMDFKILDQWIWEEHTLAILAKRN